MSEITDERLAEVVSEMLAGRSVVFKTDEAIAIARELQERRASSPAAGRDAVIEECAKVAEALDRVGREWVPDSIWDKINRDAAKRIRAMKETP